MHVRHRMNTAPQSQKIHLETKDILMRVDANAFTHEVSDCCKGCYLIHLIHTSGKSGHMRVEDSINRQYRIYDSLTSHLLELHKTIDSLVESGWAVGAKS